ncbi:MAG: helix-turn-helix domain-containing protein [Pseudomonadota bacterium]
MARPREFDIDIAVEKAMQVFWQHGYGETSLPDLLEGMEIARGSLYKAFGSKKALFLKALALYDKLYVQPGIDVLNDTTIKAEKRIELVFDGAIAAAQSGDRRGCLLCNSAAGLASDDEEIEAVVNDQVNRLTDAFATALKDTKAFSNAHERALMGEAKSLTLSYVGLRILTRSGQSANALTQAAGQTLSRFQ